MRVLAVEDEAILLRRLAARIAEALPDAEVLAFDNPGDALEALKDAPPDIAFLDIAIGDMSGVDLARRIQDAHPSCDIVFCTGYGDYATQAFDLGASDYLMKPITKEKIQHALSLLRHVDAHELERQGLYIRCFGEFEVFHHGEPLTSLTRRSKELLAYLVDKAGAVCTSSEISRSIFPDNADSYIRVVKRDLVRSLADIGQEGVLVRGWGSLGVDRTKVRCDYFDLLDGRPEAAGRYRGSYMAQYAWAAPTRSALARMERAWARPGRP